MLYKKYHRNYVRQFKKGTKFKWNTEKLSEVVMIEPYFSNDYHEIRMCGSKYSYECSWILVTLSGQLADSCLNII